ncbi:MAG: ferrochelatase [Rhodothermales bacterium]|nr:ferrochelatase [Rhodothermales bacterium]
MTPREFLKEYRYDERLVTGQFFSPQALDVAPGDRVGVVLLNLGGPESAEDVTPFLYNLFMDPVIIDIPVWGWLRDWLCRFIATTRAKSVGADYEVIGGGSPINRLTREQAEALEAWLNEHYGATSGVSFRTYIAMRYWHPFSEEAAAQMDADGVTKVVLLPLFPQYSKTTTGSSLMYWRALQERGEIPEWPTTFAFEYAANPKYVQALSERIDQALQRFPRAQRDDVQLVFSAHGTPVKEMKERRDPYCCLIHSTVDRVMALRGHDRPYHVAFQSKVGPAEWLTPSTPDTLKALASEGKTAVLVIPVAFVTDHIETSYELDIEVREEAEEAGIHHYEVMPALNCHPLFIEALAEATVAQLALPTKAGVNGSAPLSPRPILEQPTFHPSERCTRCHQCERIAEAHRWGQPAEKSPARPEASV